MSLEVLSGAGYYEAAKAAVTMKAKPDTGSVQQDNTAVNINVTEVPVAMKAVSSSQQGNTQEKGQRENQATEQQIRDAISKTNYKLKAHRTRCEFSYHEDTKRISIKVLDSETQQVIREIPPEQTLEMVEKMWELAGLLVDEKR